MLDRPIIEMFWVAEYNNGECLSQLDPFTGRENKFEWVDHKNIVRMWLVPISPSMMGQFPMTMYNPRLKRHALETKGSKSFVARRVARRLYIGKDKEVTIEKLLRELMDSHKVICYVLGIEGGPRVEVYPDGSVIYKEWPDRGESQDILHHG